MDDLGAEEEQLPLLHCEFMSRHIVSNFPGNNIKHLHIIVRVRRKIGKSCMFSDNDLLTGLQKLLPLHDKLIGVGINLALYIVVSIHNPLFLRRHSLKDRKHFIVHVIQSFPL